MTSVYDFRSKDISGKDVSLGDYRGKVLLIVNTASKCGFTPQYEGLEALYRDLQARGLVVLGFPCNQFGAQEPGDAAEIAQFCKLTYDVSFPMFAKIEVNGPMTAPLYQELKRSARGMFGSQSIKWNFTKFLVDRSGKIVARYGPQYTPQQLRKSIEALL
jgi:glutathione peroxidase